MSAPERDGVERTKWLVDRLHYAIQFYVCSDAEEKDVADLIDSLDEWDAFDSRVAALVQMPKGFSACDAQGAVDKTLATRQSDAARTPSAREKALEEAVVGRIVDWLRDLASAPHQLYPRILSKVADSIENGDYAALAARQEPRDAE